MKLILIKIVVTLIILSLAGGLTQALSGDNSGRTGPMPFIVSIAVIAGIIGVWRYKPEKKEFPGDKSGLDKNL